MRENNVAVYFIGAGPGDPDLITVRGLELISRADLVLYAGSLVPKEVLAAARNDARVEDSAPLSLEETHALIMDTVRAGGSAVRVHTGEPSSFGMQGGYWRCRIPRYHLQRPQRNQKTK